jgi:hypothetical protein
VARDYTSIYNIQDFILSDVAPKYFEVSDVSLLKIGLFGMITDVLGSSLEDQFEAVGKYLNESLVQLAQLPEFIYAYAASYAVTDLFATPAQMPMFLFIKESDITKNMKPVGNHYEFTLDSDMKIYVDRNELVYSIPYDIVIRTTKYKGEYSHIAVYDTSYINSIAKITNPYLRIIRLKYNNDNWLAIRVMVYQYERKKYPENIITNNKLNIPYITRKFDNQLCNFEAFYQDSNGHITQLEKRMETSTPVTTPFVYYKMEDDNTIRFSFANDDRYFVPEYNSTLIIHMYTTQGDQGNFDWNVNDIQASPKPETEDENIAYNRSLFMDGSVLGASAGGLNQKTLEDIRALTRERMVTIGSYTSDTDLNIHFLNFGKMYNISALFIKHRDDLAGRIYGCFTKIGNGTDIYPTNTLDIRLSTDQADDNFSNLYQYIIKPGRRFGYSGDSRDTLVVLGKDAPKEEIEYTNIALIQISLQANSMRYYVTSIDKNVILQYYYMNSESTFNFIAGNCRIFRDAINGDNKYRITVDLTRADGIESITENGVTTPYVADPKKIHVLLIFDTAAGHYIEMTLTNTDESNLIYSFQTYLTTNDMIDDSRISITNLSLRETGEVESRIIDMMNPGISIAIFYEYDTNTNHQFNDITVVAKSTLCNIYIPDENEFYLAYPLTLMRSHVIFEDSPLSDAGYGFLLKQVPVVGKDFMMNSANAKDVFNQITYQHDYLMDTVRQITENFTISIKFYNTYGRSRLFYLPDKKTLLNRVNSNISLKIAFNEGITPEDYLPSIRIFIKEYIEELNNSYVSSGINYIHMSVLIYGLHTSYSDQIKYIEFESINGYEANVQTIQAVEEIDATTDPTVIPEYITLSTDDVNITVI